MAKLELKIDKRAIKGGVTTLCKTLGCQSRLLIVLVAAWISGLYWALRVCEGMIENDRMLGAKLILSLSVCVCNSMSFNG